MEVYFPHGELRISTLGAIDPGEFFLPIDNDHGVGGLCIKAIGGTGKPLMVTLEGEDPFRLHHVGTPLLDVPVIHIDASNVQYVFSSGEAAADNHIVGSLVVSSEPTRIVIRPPSGAGSDSYTVSLEVAQGAIKHDPPRDYAMIPRWKIVYRTPYGDEKDLFSYGY